MTTDQAFEARFGRVQAYAIFMRNTDAFKRETDEGRKLLREHLEYALALEDAGVMFAGGPIQAPKSTENDSRFVDANGMWLVIVDSLEAVYDIVANEPLTKAGWRLAQVYPWTVNEGVAVNVARTMAEKK